MTELLVVIVIIAILLSLLLPTLTESRRRAQRVVCANALRQYGLALHLYGGDYDDFFPTPPEENASWQTELRTFWQLIRFHLPAGGPSYHDRYETAAGRSAVPELAIPAAMLCPAAAASFESHLAALRAADVYEARPSRLGVYATALVNYDKHPAAGQMAGKRRLTELESPSRYFFINDTGFNDGTDDRTFPFWRQGEYINGALPWGHGRYYLLGFIDGHAEGLPRKLRLTHWSYVFTRLLNDE